MKAALTRYRVMSYIVGTLLVLLFFVAMPLKYAGANDSLVAIIGPVHGFLYVFYLITAFDVSRRAGWPLKQTLLVLLAGTVPVVSFIAERWVHRQIAPRLATEAA